MTSFLLSIVVLLAFCLGTYGWGRLVVHLCYPAEHAPGVAFSVTLGIASWFILGGVLNATHLAYPITIYLLYASGVCLAAFFSLKAARHQDGFAARLGEIRARLLTRRMAPMIVLHAVVLAVWLFLVAMLMPSDTFNMHDDFQNYMARPVRMLETGTAGGDPFDTMGFDGLGAQEFSHACFLVALPVQFMNGFDAVCCFGLCMLLLLEIGRRHDIHWFVTASALLAFVLIHPLAVNVSALYSASLMIIASVIAGCLVGELHDNPDAGVAMRATVPLAMFIASLALLKITFMIFAGVFSVILLGLWLLLQPKRRRSVGAGLVAVTVILTASVPWLVVHTEKYAAFINRLGSRATAQPAVPLSPTGGLLAHLDSLFSEQQLYGTRFYYYSVIVALLAAAAALSLLLYRRGRNGNRDLIVVAAACLATCLSFVALTYTFRHGIRYSTPFLIAILPTVLILMGKHFLRPIGPSTMPPESQHRPGNKNQGGKRRRPDKKTRQQLIEIRQLRSRQIAINTATIVFLLALNGMLLAFFGNKLLFRSNQIINSRAILSWTYSERLPQYSLLTMSEDTRDQLRSIQGQTEEGASILTYISCPFQLDYSRNEIFETTDVALDRNWWLGYPAGGDTEDVRDFLLASGIQYVLWDHQGFGMRRPQKLGSHMLHFRRALIQMRDEGEVIVDSGQTVLIDLAG